MWGINSFVQVDFDCIRSKDSILTILVFIVLNFVQLIILIIIIIIIPYFNITKIYYPFTAPDVSPDIKYF